MDSNNPSQDSFINECESCCYEVQNAGPLPYKCMINDIMHQYKMRLKKAQMDLTDRDLVIALLKDQHAKMENYCRCHLEETQSIKAKYSQLVLEMENIRKEYEIQRNKPMNENDEYLESCLKAEVGKWKKENKDILSKIELMEFDVQRLLKLISERPNNNSENEIKFRMAKLEAVIENQSAILALLHSKVAEHSKAITFVNRKVGSKLDEIMERTNKSRDDLREEILYLKKKTESLTQNSSKMSDGPPVQISPDQVLILSSSVEGGSPDRRRVQKLEECPNLVVNPEDDVRISIQIQRASNLDKNKASDGNENLRYLPPESKTQKTTDDVATNTEAEIEEIHQHQNTNEQDTMKTDVMADFFEIATREKEFFDKYGTKSENFESPSRSEQLSEISELGEGEYKKIFRELPVDASKAPEKKLDDYIGFNEFEHYESGLLSGRKDPDIHPSDTVNKDAIMENDNMNKEKSAVPYIKIIPKCCSIPNDELDENVHEYKIVLFDDTHNSKIPICCRISEDTVEPLRIEEIKSSHSSTGNYVQSKVYDESHEKIEDPTYEPPDDKSNQKYPKTPDDSTQQPTSFGGIPKLWHTTLDESTSLSSNIDRVPQNGDIIEKVSGPLQLSEGKTPEPNSLFEENQNISAKIRHDTPLTHSVPATKNVRNEIPECCRIPEGSDNTNSKSDKKTPDNIKDEVEEIKLDELTIVGSEAAPKPVIEEEISVKSVVPYSNKPTSYGNEKDSRRNINDEKKHLIPLREQLHKALNQLEDLLLATKQETSTLHNLKEDFTAMNEEWNQDLPIIKSSIELINKTLNEMTKDVHKLKTDVGKLLSEQEQNKRQNTQENNLMKEQNEENSKRVLQRVNSLEKHLCTCDTGSRAKKYCHPSTGCSCKYKTIEGSRMLKGGNSMKDTQISFTVQPCFLNSSAVIKKPFIMNLENDTSNGIAALTYEIKKDNIKGKKSNTTQDDELPTN